MTQNEPFYPNNKSQFTKVKLYEKFQKDPKIDSQSLNGQKMEQNEP